MLSNYPFLHSFDYDRCRAKYAAYGLGWRLLEKLKDRPSFHVQVNMIDSPRNTVFFYRHSHWTEINPGKENPDHWLTFPVRVHGRSAGAMRLGILKGASRLASPGRPDPHPVGGGQYHAGLCIKGGPLRRHFEMMTGMTAHRDIVFDPSFDTRKSAARNVARQLAFWMEEEESEPGSGMHPLRLRDLFERVASTLLLYHPHNHSARLDRRNPGPASRDVKRVLDFIEAEADQPVTLGALVEVAGVPGRTLNEHFRTFVGLSPMAYLRRLRLERARQDLASGAVESVTEVALKWQFANLGRFSAAYLQAFGERPSETRARCQDRA